MDSRKEKNPRTDINLLTVANKEMCARETPIPAEQLILIAPIDPSVEEAGRINEGISLINQYYKAFLLNIYIEISELYKEARVTQKAIAENVDNYKYHIIFRENLSRIVQKTKDLNFLKMAISEKSLSKTIACLTDEQIIIFSNVFDYVYEALLPLKPFKENIKARFDEIRIELVNSIQSRSASVTTCEEQNVLENSQISAHETLSLQISLFDVKEDENIHISATSKSDISEMMKMGWQNAHDKTNRKFPELPFPSNHFDCVEAYYAYYQDKVMLETNVELNSGYFSSAFTKIKSLWDTISIQPLSKEIQAPALLSSDTTSDAEKSLTQVGYYVSFTTFLAKYLGSREYQEALQEIPYNKPTVYNTDFVSEEVFSKYLAYELGQWQVITNDEKVQDVASELIVAVEPVHDSVPVPKCESQAALNIKNAHDHNTFQFLNAWHVELKMMKKTLDQEKTSFQYLSFGCFFAKKCFDKSSKSQKLGDLIAILEKIKKPGADLNVINKEFVEKAHSLSEDNEFIKGISSRCAAAVKSIIAGSMPKQNQNEFIPRRNLAM